MRARDLPLFPLVPILPIAVLVGSLTTAFLALKRVRRLDHAPAPHLKHLDDGAS